MSQKKKNHMEYLCMHLKIINVKSYFYGVLWCNLKYNRKVAVKKIRMTGGSNENAENKTLPEQWCVVKHWNTKAADMVPYFYFYANIFHDYVLFHVFSFSTL